MLYITLFVFMVFLRGWAPPECWNPEWELAVFLGSCCSCKLASPLCTDSWCFCCHLNSFNWFPLPHPLPWVKTCFPYLVGEKKNLSSEVLANYFSIIFFPQPAEAQVFVLAKLIMSECSNFLFQSSRVTGLGYKTDVVRGMFSQMLPTSFSPCFQY